MFSLKPIFFSLLFISSSALAINVGKVTTIIPADADSTAKELKNEADSVRIISISAQRISSPMDEGVVINPEQTDELLLTPTRMVMPAGTSNIVKFYYHGKADDRERYYRITFIDEGVSEDLDNGTKKEWQRDDPRRGEHHSGGPAPEEERRFRLRGREDHQ